MTTRTVTTRTVTTRTVTPRAAPGPGARTGGATAVEPLAAHLLGSRRALDDLEPQLARLADWGRELGDRLGTRRARLLVAGNGGSAALAQHLSAEVVGRYRRDRPAFDALSLHADTSTVTALVNDYGPDAMFARQVEGCGRPGDVLLLLSTSGRSSNLLAAADTARTAGITTWAMTGPGPNPLAARCDDALLIAADAPHVQEAQQVAVHLLCEAFDREVAGS